MTSSAREIDRAFGALEHRLLARRWAACSLRVRAVAVLLAAYVVSIAYWQARVPLDGLCRSRGPGAAALALLAGLAALALLAGAIAAWRRAALAARVPGPEWLALPLPPVRVARHLRFESRWPAAAVAPAALAALAAGVGLLNPVWLVLLAAAFVAAWLEATRLGVALAWRAALPGAKLARGLPANARALAAAARPAPARERQAPAWRAESRSRAVARLDALVSFRRSAARTRLLIAALALLAALAAWFAPAPAAQRRALGFLAFMTACAALGAWAIARTCADPPGAVRALPLSWRDLWRARFGFVARVAFAAVLLNAALAFALPPAARAGLLLAWLPPGLAVALLGLHYGLTLAPRATAAENLYYGWLGVALLASWMVPLLGWAVLLAGLVHSALRLPRWWRPEVG